MTGPRRPNSNDTHGPPRHAAATQTDVELSGKVYDLFEELSA